MHIALPLGGRPGLYRTAIAGACIILVACSEGTSVRPFGGSYVLNSVNGHPIPQPLYPDSTNPLVVGGTLIVKADSLDVTSDFQAVDTSGRPVGTVMPFESKIPYVRQGDSLIYVGSASGPFGGKVVGNDVRLVLGLARLTPGFPDIVTYQFSPQ